MTSWGITLKIYNIYDRQSLIPDIYINSILNYRKKFNNQ